MGRCFSKTQVFRGVVAREKHTLGEATWMLQVETTLPSTVSTGSVGKDAKNRD
jgi:hypothetical protein